MKKKTMLDLQEFIVSSEIEFEKWRYNQKYVFVELENGYTAHLMDEGIVFSHYGDQCSIAEISYEEFIKISDCIKPKELPQKLGSG